MIKINLLHSVTERQAGAIDVVDQKIGSAASRFLVLALVVGFMTLAVIGWDVVSSRMAKSAAETELAAQKVKEQQLQSVIDEQKDLEAKINAIDARIDAIKKLRANQAGPSAVLEAMKERVAMVPGLYLESVEQKGDSLELKGSSTDESQVTQFGRSLEFSNGLFSNLSIETKREDVTNNQAKAVTASATTPANPDAGKLSVVKFDNKCAYTASKGNSPNANPTNGPANAPAQPAQPGKN
jgi:Tfp pilus assembly protein PilN